MKSKPPPWNVSRAYVSDDWDFMWKQGFFALSPLDNLAVKNIAGFPRPTATSTGIASVGSEVGSVLEFPNAGTNPPEDFYAFSGLPTTNADIVPHTAFAVWKGTTNRTHDVWGSGGDGDGWNMRGGTSDFTVLHGGVVGFAGIGTFVIGDFFAQCYSYDQITMRHLVRNMSTGKLASQEVAETRNIRTSVQPQIGARGNFEVLQGEGAIVGWKPGALSIPQMRKWANDPFAFITYAARRAAKAPAAAVASLLFYHRLSRFPQLRM